MNHQGGKLIYESCPSVCNVAGQLPFVIWVDPIRCDGWQNPAEGAVGKENRGTNEGPKPEQANKLTLHCNRKILFAAAV